ncbi:thymidine kinase [Alicyclobacillus sp. SO9]|uniref:thymidine kinase n=1 Tax=Alicyclobacillus sp. SO9 TaxID=2665646 RepID=UPI0018E7BC14|nr:thymidine kinase [Alicyclobacillus sp. SO9]QQE77187.1 thymidine kinase [Alicyclobacillus sp. SO9]
MSKLYFRFGAMNASKSVQLLTVAYNYEEQGKKVLCFTPSTDDRYGHGKITSRVGISREALIVHSETDMFTIVEQNPVDCVLVDEAQFLTREHIQQLANVADDLNTPVMCYGLLKDFRNQFFEGSEALVLLADSIEEIKTICEHHNCGRKATMILKIENGMPIYDGRQVEIGDAQYHSVCRFHYFHPQGIVTKQKH